MFFFKNCPRNSVEKLSRSLLLLFLAGQFFYRFPWTILGEFSIWGRRFFSKVFNYKLLIKSLHFSPIVEVGISRLEICRKIVRPVFCRKIVQSTSFIFSPWTIFKEKDSSLKLILELFLFCSNEVGCGFVQYIFFFRILGTL